MPTVSAVEVLMIVSEIAGILLLIGTMLLVGFRRVYIDRETKQPTEIEFPIIGRFKTQTPALALIVIGAVLVLFPITQARPDMATIHGNVKVNGRSMSVVVVAVPTYEETLDSEGPYKINVPVLKDVSYRVKFIVDRQIINDQAAEFENGDAKLADVEYQEVTNPSAANQLVKTDKEVPDALLQKLGIPH